MLYFCMMIGNLAIGTLDMYKAFGQTFIHDDQFLAMVGAGASVFNCAGRVIGGLLVDRFSFKVNFYL